MTVHAQVCLEGMIKQKYGKIVNVTSQSEVIATKAHATCEGGKDGGGRTIFYRYTRSGEEVFTRSSYCCRLEAAIFHVCRR